MNRSIVADLRCCCMKDLFAIGFQKSRKTIFPPEEIPKVNKP